MHDYVVGATSTGDNAVLAMLENHAMVLAPPAGAKKVASHRRSPSFRTGTHRKKQRSLLVYSVFGLLRFPRLLDVLRIHQSACWECVWSTGAACGLYVYTKVPSGASFLPGESGRRIWVFRTRMQTRTMAGAYQPCCGACMRRVCALRGFSNRLGESASRPLGGISRGDRRASRRRRVFRMCQPWCLVKSYTGRVSHASLVRQCAPTSQTRFRVFFR